MTDNQYNDFLKWLELNTDLVEKSMKKYASAVNKITNGLIKSKVIQHSLDEIKDVEQLQKIKNDFS